MTRHAQNEHGAVAVMVALMMPLFVLLLAFAVDASHWWVHKAHLQAQVDAGVYAGGLGPWLPTCDNTAIEQTARQYSGDYSGGYVGTDPTFNDQYSNATNVHVLVNSEAFESLGGSNYSEEGLDPCDTLMAPTDPDKPAYIDLKATESDLPNFLGSVPGFSVLPWISDLANAHARVQIEKQSGGEGIKPIAVRDDTAYQCAEIIRYEALSDGSTGLLLGSPITLARTTGPPTTPYTEFRNATGVPVTMPNNGTNVYLRVKLYANHNATGACTGPADEYPTNDDGDPVGGANFINVYSAGSNPSPQDPFVRRVELINGGCAPDQYFSTGACAGSASAIVQFATGAIKSGVNQNVFVTIGGANATNIGGDVWSAPFSFAAATGPHPLKVEALQRFGSTSKGNCNNPNRCRFDFGVKQQSYSATNDDSEPSSSGPISMVQIGEGSPGVGANSFERNTTHNLVFTVRLTGLANSGPTDPPIVLRYRVKSSKRTGLVDCGQGNGANADEDAIINGCPRDLYIWPVGSTCVTPTNSTAPTAIDCVGNTPGNRTNKIPGAIRQRVGNSCNNWNAYRNSNGATSFPPGDPRMMTFIITSPADLSGKSGSKPDIPIQLFATFYVTGADHMTGNGNGCQNEPYPGPGNNDQAAVWGHWIKWSNTTGTGSGDGCKPNEFGACVAVLTD